MVKYELPAEPELHSTVRDNQGERYVGFNNDKGFQRWYFIRNPEGINIKSETPNWTWAELLSAFGPVELVEKMVRKIDASCVHCGSWIKAEAQALHSAWHDNLADTVYRQTNMGAVDGQGRGVVRFDPSRDVGSRLDAGVDGSKARHQPETP